VQEQPAKHLGPQAGTEQFIKHLPFSLQYYLLRLE